jgi:hypothetical protein
MNKNGYKIVLSDLSIDHELSSIPEESAFEDYFPWINGTPDFVAFSVDSNVEENRQAYILNGFKGEVDRIMLCNSQTN